MSNKMIIPYFNIYASDFKAFKDKLTSDEFIQVIDAICDICLFGDANSNFENKFQELFFNKLKENLTKSANRYKSCIDNGKRGGRPKKEDNPDETQKKPTGFELDNPDETQTKPIKEKKRKEKKKEEKELKKYGEFQNVKLTDEQYNRLKDIYNSKIDEAIEILSNYLAAKGDKYKNHYAVLNKSNWVYNKVFIDKKPEPEPYNVYM